MNIAKLQQLKDSIEQKKLAELKEVAAELNVQSTQVKNYGSLSLKQTWLEAINTKISELLEGSAIVPHGEDRTEGVEPGGSPNTITQDEETMVKELPLSTFQIPVPDSTPLPSLPFDPDEDEDEDEDDDDDDDDDEATLKTVSPICADIISALPQFNYYQLIAFHYGVLLSHQDHQPVAYAIDSLDYNDRFSAEQSLSLKLPEFIPDKYERDRLIQIIKELKASFKKPENCCPVCDGLGNIFAGIADHLIDWETCETCDGKGFLETEPKLSQSVEPPISTIDIFPKDFDNYPQSGITEERFSQIISEAEEIAKEYLIKNPWKDGEFEQMYNLPNPSIEEKNEIPFCNDSDETWPDCPDCTNGLSPGGDICPTCNGAQQIYPNYKTSLLNGGKSNFLINAEIYQESGEVSPNNSCETCFGTGLVPDFNGDGDEICPDCNGTGYEKSYQAPKPDADDDFNASDFEKETVIEFFREEGSTPEELDEVRQQPMTKMDAAIVLGFAEHYKKSAEITLRLYLIDWVNDINGERCLNWKSVAEAKEKLAYHFQLRPGEINCFITPDGWRVSVPLWMKEEILTQEKSELLSPDDPVIQMMGNGYLFALEQFKKQVTISQVDLSMTHK